MSTLCVRPIDHPQEWDTFVRSQPYALFVQSPAYADFYAAMGEHSWIYGVYDEDKTLIGGSVVIGIHARRGSFLYLPYGPLAQEGRYQDVLSALTQYLRKIHGRHYAFIRSAPFIEDSPDHQGWYIEAGYRKAPMHMLAETTWILPITENSETLLAQMKKNHRNLIRRCMNEGVRIEMDVEDASIKALNDLLDITVKRHKFFRFSRTYITKEFEAFKSQGDVAVFRAFLPDGTLDAAAVVMYYGNMAAYRHGASKNEDKRLPTSYLIQWHAIQEAQRRGISWYNFWGIAPEDAPESHPFKGITHFKKGFGGEQKDLLPCQDYPLRKTYYLNWAVETLRRIKRGFS